MKHAPPAGLEHRQSPGSGCGEGHGAEEEGGQPLACGTARGRLCRTVHTDVNMDPNLPFDFFFPFSFFCLWYCFKSCERCIDT